MAKKAGTRKKTVEKALPEMQKKFCFELARTGNAVLAAKVAGYKKPGDKPAELLSKPEIADDVEQQAKLLRKIAAGTAYAGFERLAFGEVTDAVKLVFMENVRSSDIDGMDLMNIAEIKRGKDNSVEIKFFDRIKALEKLRESLIENDENAAGIIGALKSAALGLSGDDGGGS